MVYFKTKPTKSNPQSWIYSMLINKVINYFKSQDSQFIDTKEGKIIMKDAISYEDFQVLFLRKKASAEGKLTHWLEIRQRATVYLQSK